MTTYASANNKPSEVAAKRRVLDAHIIPALGDLTLSQVTGHEVDKFKAALLETKPSRQSSENRNATLSKKTVRNILAVLSRLLHVAQDWDYLENVPRIRQVKAPLPTMGFLHVDEANRLLDATEPSWRTLVLAALRTGMRLASAAARL